MAIENQISELNVSSASYADKTTVVGQPDVPGLGTQAMQESVEYMPRNLLAPKINEIARAVNSSYSREETEAAISRRVTAIGAGDMTKAVYDPDNAGLSFTDLQTAKSELAAAQAAIAAMENKEFVRVTLKAAGWALSADGAYYWQTVGVAGMTDEWVPDRPSFDPDVYGEPENIRWNEVALQVKELAKINAVQSYAGGLNFVCFEDTPTWDIYLRVPRMGGRAG